jgi:hypothetical protein
MADRRNDLGGKYDPSLTFGQAHHQTARPGASSFDSGPMVEGFGEAHKEVRQGIAKARRTGHEVLRGVGSVLETTKETLNSIQDGAIDLQKGAKEAVQTLEETRGTLKSGVETASSVASTLKDVGEWLTSAPKVLDSFNQTAQGLAGKDEPLVVQSTTPALRPDRPAP